MAELAFEKFGVPALYFAPSPVLAAFSAARSTALVIDSGAEMTSVVPVVDSFVMKKGLIALISNNHQLSKNKLLLETLSVVKPTPTSRRN
jgi:actin-related protein